jgi:DNA-binding winged helix-turn-helix (wHTH) protein
LVVTHTRTFGFGPYLFVPKRQLLLRGGKAVRVGCRALDLLAALVQRPGEMLTKRDLMQEAWPCTTVVEGNLKVHIAALRRVLEDDPEAARYIATVNGRGYRFIAPVEAGDAASMLLPTSKMPAAMTEFSPARAEMEESRFRDIVTQLARAMRSVVVDLPMDAELIAASLPPRRVLCIELAPTDEAWIETMFAHPGRAMSATL